MFRALTRYSVKARSAMKLILRLYGRNRLHFDEESFLDQAIDHQQRVRRIDAVFEHAREFTPAKIHEFADVLGVDQIGGELHDIVPAGVRGSKRNFDIGEGLPALREEVGLSDEVAASIGGHHPGDEQELARLDPRDLRILPERISELRKV